MPAAYLVQRRLPFSPARALRSAHRRGAWATGRRGSVPAGDPAGERALSWRAAGACLAPSPAKNPKGSVLVPVGSESPGAPVAVGTPEQGAVKADTSYTGRFLAEI